jgi:hypothetical protein
MSWIGETGGLLGVDEAVEVQSSLPTANNVDPFEASLARGTYVGRNPDVQLISHWPLDFTL